MIPSRPYLFRAMYEWVLDNHWVPYVLVQVDAHPEVSVPLQYVEDGRIVLDLSPTAVRHLVMANTHVVFDARFSGRPFQVFLPMRAILAIYAKENSQGMTFSPADWFESEEDDDILNAQLLKSGPQIQREREKFGPLRLVTPEDESS